MDEGLLGVFDREWVRRAASHLDKRRRLYLGVFLIGFVAGYPAAELIIEWLLDSDGFIPTGVEVIILQPLEVIMLQLRIAVQIAFGLTIARVVSAMLAVVALGAMGLAYAHNVLIPFLLEYLAADSAESGLQSTWQLQSWVGFVTGLYFSSVLGFQVPILAVLLIRSGIIERGAIVENRGLIWFAALFIGALISPPDPISLFLVGGPMLVLLEVALIYERLTNGE